MLSPRPAPPADVRPRARSPRQKRSQTRDCSWAGIPGPSSATITSAQRPLRCTLTRPGVQAECGRIRGEQVVARLARADRPPPRSHRARWSRDDPERRRSHRRPRGSTARGQPARSRRPTLAGASHLRQRDNPSRPGRLTWSTRTCQASLRARASPCGPVAAVSTVNPVKRSAVATRSRIGSSSSTRRIRSPPGVKFAHQLPPYPTSHVLSVTPGQASDVWEADSRLLGRSPARLGLCTKRSPYCFCEIVPLCCVTFQIKRARCFRAIHRRFRSRGKERPMRHRAILSLATHLGWLLAEYAPIWHRKHDRLLLRSPHPAKEVQAAFGLRIRLRK